LLSLAGSDYVSHSFLAPTYLTYYPEKLRKNFWKFFTHLRHVAGLPNSLSWQHFIFCFVLFLLPFFIPVNRKQPPVSGKKKKKKERKRKRKFCFNQTEKGRNSDEDFHPLFRKLAVGHVCSLDFKPENLSFPTEANRGRFLAH
jgi:hypothetical protein